MAEATSSTSLLTSLKAGLDRTAYRLGLHRLAYRLWRYSPAGLYRLYGHHCYDRARGVDTRGYSDPRYEPTPAPVFRRMIADLRLRHEDFVFVDFGSGKGKVLLMASEFPFKKVIGVELWQELHRIAEANLRRLGPDARQCQAVESLCMDAALYSIPPEPAVFYFFNPFPEETLARVVENIERSLKAHPRKIFIIFYASARRGTPWDRRRVLDSVGFLESIRNHRTHTVYANKQLYPGHEPPR
ncbi:MAG: class I SAM-dependent methyltransferase [Acidobacteriota bacterium]